MILVFFSISAGLILASSFESSIRDRAQEQLKIQMYGMLAAAEFEPSGLALPSHLSEPRFNQLQSGLFAAVYSDQIRIWQSQSYLEWIDLPPHRPPAGKWAFASDNTPNGLYYRVAFTVLWETERGELPFTFVIWQSDEPFRAQISGFQRTLWVWLGGLVLASICVVFVGLQLGFRPFSRLAKELQEVERGQSQQIAGEYPSEIYPVITNLNQLIVHERGMRERYKNSLGDLAHSLKTPLTVLKGIKASSDNASAFELLQQQVTRMDDIVSYQLSRAISTVPSISTQGVLLLDLFQKMRSAMKKVYAQSDLYIEQDINPDLRLPWDEGDGLEVLGNLMDNACKYGAGKVKVSGWFESESAFFSVEDNGKGIPEQDIELVLKRGGRRDEQVAGQGIGLSVVAGIIEMSNGLFFIERSELGGAKFIVKLPRTT